MEENKHKMSFNVPKYIHYILSDSHRIKLGDSQMNLKEEIEKKIHDDDLDMVKLAINTNAYLVTTNGRLEKQLKNVNIINTYNLQVIPPDKALTLAQKTDC